VLLYVQKEVNMKNVIKILLVMGFLSVLNAEDFDVLGNKMYRVCDQLTAKQKIDDANTLSYMNGVIAGVSMTALISGRTSVPDNANIIVMLVACENSYNTHAEGSTFYLNYVTEVLKSVQSVYTEPSH